MDWTILPAWHTFHFFIIDLHPPAHPGLGLAISFMSPPLSLLDHFTVHCTFPITELLTLHYNCLLFCLCPQQQATSLLLKETRSMFYTLHPQCRVQHRAHSECSVNTLINKRMDDRLLSYQPAGHILKYYSSREHFGKSEIVIHDFKFIVLLNNLNLMLKTQGNVNEFHS